VRRLCGVESIRPSVDLEDDGLAARLMKLILGVGGEGGSAGAGAGATPVGPALAARIMQVRLCFMGGDLDRSCGMGHLVKRQVSTVHPKHPLQFLNAPTHSYWCGQWQLLSGSPTTHACCQLASTEQVGAGTHCAVRWEVASCLRCASAHTHHHNPHQHNHAHAQTHAHTRAATPGAGSMVALGAPSGGAAGRLRAQGMEWCVWVIKHAPQHQLKAMAPTLLARLLPATGGEAPAVPAGGESAAGDAMVGAAVGACEGWPGGACLVCEVRWCGGAVVWLTCGLLIHPPFP